MYVEISKFNRNQGFSSNFVGDDEYFLLKQIQIVFLDESQFIVNYFKGNCGKNAENTPIFMIFTNFRQLQRKLLI